MTETWEPILPFDTDDNEFVRGFEAGEVWANAEPGYRKTVRIKNAEMIMQIAVAKGLAVRTKEVDDFWMNVYFGDDR